MCHLMVLSAISLLRIYATAQHRSCVRLLAICLQLLTSGARVSSGDTLFSMGCGRLFEGSPPQMWTSLSKIAALPPDTMVRPSVVLCC